MVTAHSANMTGIKAARWNTSEKICATMPTYARMEPNITVERQRVAQGRAIAEDEPDRARPRGCASA